MTGSLLELLLQIKLFFLNMVLTLYKLNYAVFRHFIFISVCMITLSELQMFYSGSISSVLNMLCAWRLHAWACHAHKYSIQICPHLKVGPQILFYPKSYFFVWLNTTCKISEPYDNSFWEKSKPAERKDCETHYKGEGFLSRTQHWYSIKLRKNLFMHCLYIE